MIAAHDFRVGVLLGPGFLVVETSLLVWFGRNVDQSDGIVSRSIETDLRSLRSFYGSIYMGHPLFPTLGVLPVNVPGSHLSPPLSFLVSLSVPWSQLWSEQ